MKRIKNKGFTLVELLGVIIILVLILSLVLPKVINRVKSKENVIATLNDDFLLSAAKIYVDNNKKNYPEDDGSTYCTEISEDVLSELEKYLGTHLKDYSGDELNIENKTIKIDYNKGYMVSIVDSSSCQEFTTNKNNCTGDNCKACYISKTYNNGVYKYEGKILESSNEENDISTISSDIDGYTSPDGCTLKAMDRAVEQYVNDNKDNYRPLNGNIRCITLKQIIDAGYLDPNTIYNGDLLYDSTYTYKITYHRDENKKLVYDYVLTESNTCEEYLECGTFVDLPSNMTPVVYDENVEKWKIVDQNDPDWFDYLDQKWANAVILTPAARNTKRVGDYVEVDILKKKSSGVQNTLDTLDVLGMYVWIPRYSFTVRTYNNTLVGKQVEGALKVDNNHIGEIDVKCEYKNDQRKTGSARYTDSDGGPANWRTMPTFRIYNEASGSYKETNGFWAGKFLMSYNNSTDEIECNNVNCSNADNMRTLPNLLLHMYTNVESHSVFAAFLSTNRLGNVYHNSSYTDINNNVINTYSFSHLETNTEYAAILFFKQSKYGKLGNAAYTNYNKYIYYNNSYNSDSNVYSEWTGNSSGNGSDGTVGNPSNRGIYGNYHYDDLGTRYEIDTDATYEYPSCSVDGGSCTSNFTVNTNTTRDAVHTISFTIPNNYTGIVELNLNTSGVYIRKSSLLSGSEGCNKSLFGRYTWYELKPTLKYQIYRDGILYINDYTYFSETGDEPRHKTITGYKKNILPPGTYTINVHYSTDNTVGVKSGSTCPSPYNNVQATVNDLKIKMTKNYKPYFTQTNGIGASTTGNIYGVYDIVNTTVDHLVGGGGEIVAAKYSGCTLSWCTDPTYSNYIDFYEKKVGTTLGHALGDEVSSFHDLPTFFDSCVYSDTICGNNYILARNGSSYHIRSGSYGSNAREGYRNIITYTG